MFSACLSTLENVQDCWHHVFAHNLNGNLKLAEACSRHKILWTSTMCADRIPSALQLNPKGPKGEFQTVKVDQICVKWKDRNEVKFATTGHATIERVNTQRRKPKNAGESLVWMWVEEYVSNVSNDYNNNMNGVDVADQLRTYYSTRLRTRKWHCFRVGAFDALICNAYTCYKVWFEQARMQGQPISQVVFRNAYATSLARGTEGPSPF